MNIKLIEASTPAQLEFLCNEWIMETLADVVQILPVANNANALFLLYKVRNLETEIPQEALTQASPKKK